MKSCGRAAISLISVAERTLSGGCRVALEQAEGGGAGVDEHRAQPGDEVVQKEAQVAIAFVERDPGYGLTLADWFLAARLSIQALTSVVLP